MLQIFKNGQGSIVLRVKLLDSSVSTGAGLTGLTSASSGLIIGTIADNEATTTAYTVAGSTVETITTLGTYAAPTATKCRFKEVDATNHKGVYELQFADARFAVSNAKSLLVSLSGATNLAQADFVVQLVSDDPYVAKPTNYSTLSIDGSGRVDVGKLAGTAQTGRDIGASVLLSSGTGTGQVTLTSGRVNADLTHIAAAAVSTSTAQLGVNVVNAGGTAWGSGAITAAAIADGAIDNATFAADVGSTAIATNVIGIAAKKGVVDALNVDTYAEPGQGTPAATTTLIGKIGYLYKGWRNRSTQTSTTYSLYNDDATTVDQKATVSDNGTTFDRTEIATGP